MATKHTHQCKESNNHEKNHICQIVARRDFGRVKELIKDSQFFCMNCGRAAHLAGNLCNPSKI